MQWFKHMSTMQYDVKIQRVIRRYGLEGYGLYNAILEMIVRNLETKRPMPDLEERAEDVAAQFHGDTARINEMMSFMVNQGLFELEEIQGRIVCHNVYKYLDAAQTRSEEIRSMISAYKNGENPKQITSINVCDNVTDNHEEKKRIEKKTKEAPASDSSPILRGSHIALTDDELSHLYGIFSQPLIDATIRAMNHWVRDKKGGKSPWTQIDGKYAGTRAIRKWLERDGYTEAGLEPLRKYLEAGYTLVQAKQMWEDGVSV